MKTYLLIPICMAFLMSSPLFSQIDCLTPDLESESSFLVTDCEDMANYSTSEIYPEQMPILYINVNIHFMLHETGDPGNFSETTTAVTDISGYEYALEIIDAANDKLATTETYSINLPYGAAPPSLATRFRYRLAGDADPGVTGDDGVYFHRDDDYYYFDYNNATLYGASNSAHVLCPESPTGFGHNTSTELNIFFQESDDGKALIDKRFSGYAPSPPYASPPYVPFVIISSGWTTYRNGFGPFHMMANLLVHEIGHDLGLSHTWNSIDNCSDTPENCNCYAQYITACKDADGCPPAAGACNIPADCPCAELDACDVEFSNNIMDYNVYRQIFSPCQHGRINYWLVHEPVLNYVYKDYCEILDADLVIDDPGEEIVWESKRIMKGNIRIKALTTLIIKCWVGMPADAKIFVEGSGKLIIDGGTISSNCGELWQGIEVWGVGSGTPHPTVSSIHGGTYPASSSDHGVVYMLRNATLELSRNGISTRNYAEIAHPENFWGGIIVASESSFLNNWRSAEFMKYDYTPAETNDDNISVFLLCNFEMNDDYPCDETFNTHITMWDVDGVEIIGCTFKDLRDACTNNGRGIYSIDATYTVASNLCYGATPCTDDIGSFEGFYKGIEVENANSRPRDIVVGDIEFINNYRGILLSNVNNSLIINNTFEVPDIPTTSYNAYGIYLEDCDNYHVENNNFTTFGSYDDASPYNAGIYVVNNSDAVTEVYRNTFDELEAGVRVQTENSKLQIKCNTFNSIIEKHDIYVTNTGTLGHQGLCLSNFYACPIRVNSPAGNTFSFDCNNTQGDFKIYSGHPELKYRHHSETSYTPSCYTTGVTYITLQPCTYTHDLGSECVACMSTLPEGGTGFRLDGSNATSAYGLYSELVTTQEWIDEMVAALEVEEYELEYNSGESVENDDLTYLLNLREQLLDDCTNLYFMEGKVDSAISVLKNFDIEGLDKKIIEYEFLIGDFASAESNLDNMSSSSVENSDFKVLYGILIDNAKTGSTILSLGESDLGALESIAGKQSKSGVAAENLLTFLTGAEYEEVFDNDNEEIEERQILNEQTEVNIYPNPVSGELFIDIISLNEGSQYNLIVYDITGKKLLQSEILGNATTSLKTTNIQKGLLFIQIIENNQILITEKIVNE